MMMSLNYTLKIPLKRNMKRNANIRQIENVLENAYMLSKQIKILENEQLDKDAYKLVEEIFKIYHKEKLIIKYSDPIERYCYYYPDERKCRTYDV